MSASAMAQPGVPLSGELGFAPRPLRAMLVTPVFNDAEAFRQLCVALDQEVEALGVSLTVVAVDDGSDTPLQIDDAFPALRHIKRVEVVTLICNLGHQRAIAVGLAHAAQRADVDLVFVADCDGEDRPADLRRLLDAHRQSPQSIIVGSRQRRTEGLRFRLFYRLYKLGFRLLTGRQIDFGNFCLVPRAALARLVHMPETWNHIAAAILRSRLRRVAVPCDRGTRYAGRSSMGLVSLMVHGLSAIAVFSDQVFARSFVGAMAIGATALAIAGVAVGIRTVTEFAIPGWATTVVGVSMIVLLQSIVLSVVASLTMLGTRSTAVFVPALQALQFRKAHASYLRKGAAWLPASPIRAAS